MKWQKERDILLNITIRDFKELNCAKTVQAVFDVLQTVEVTIQKLSRKGNIFIDDPKNFKLKFGSLKLKKDKKLAEYGLQDKVYL
jgi:hypothetical protein